MKTEEEDIEFDLSSLKTSPFRNRGVIERFLEIFSEDLKISDNQKITIVGNKLQIEKFFQMLKMVEYSIYKSNSF
jgi:hypothetical protein